MIDWVLVIIVCTLFLGVSCIVVRYVLLSTEALILTRIANRARVVCEDLEESPSSTLLKGKLGDLRSEYREAYFNLSFEKSKKSFPERLDDYDWFYDPRK